MFEGCRILIITDIVDSVDEIKRQLKADKKNIHVANVKENGIKLFDEIKPSIVILYYSLVEQSQEVYFELYKESSTIKEVKHRGIVLCDHSDVEKANEKCMRNIFFDYVMFSPRFDRCRINLSIRNALKSIGSVDEHDKARELIRASKTAVVECSDTQDTTNDTKIVREHNLKTFENLSNDIKKDVQELSEKLISSNKESAQEDQSAMISKTINSFSDDVLSKRIDDSKSRVQTIVDKYTTHVSNNQNKLKKSLSDLESLANSLPKKILIIEDNEIFGEMVYTMLEQTGIYEAELVSTVHQGLVSYVCNKPDMVLLDYELEDADASVFLEKAGDLSQIKNIPIIMLTSHNTKDVFTTTSMLGAKSFIEKPASKDIILSNIEKYIN